MKISKKINIVQVFDSYPLFYQPYIPPVIDRLRSHSAINLTINAYQGKGSRDVDVFPTYFYRKIIAKFHSIFSRKQFKLNYSEIKYLKNNVDIVHIQHSYLFPKVLGLLELPKQDRPKIVITLRGGDTYIKPLIHDKWKNFYRDFGNCVDAFVVMSLHQKHYLQQLGVDTNRIYVIPISFGNPFEIIAKYPDPDLIKIVSAHRMCWEKNIDGNLRTIKLLKEKNLPIQYHIYGDGPDAGQVLYLIDKYDLQDCVTYLGKIAYADLKVKIVDYDFFLQLSHSESFGVSVVEAQSVGIPALVSNSGGLPEAILPNKSGYSVDTYDTEKAASFIENLWKNKETYFQFSEHAIHYSHENFNINCEVKKLTDLYNQLMDELN